MKGDSWPLTGYVNVSHAAVSLQDTALLVTNSFAVKCQLRIWSTTLMV